MSELRNLNALRNKLVDRRRALVQAQLGVSADQVNGESVARIQEAIDAVDRALADEADEDIRRRGL